MDTVDKVDSVATKKRGRPKKSDKATPMGEYIAEQAKTNRERKETNKVVEKYYELRNHKLTLCKKLSSGSVYKTYVGSTEDKKDGKTIQDFARKLEQEGRLRKVI